MKTVISFKDPKNGNRKTKIWVNNRAAESSTTPSFEIEVDGFSTETRRWGVWPSERKSEPCELAETILQAVRDGSNVFPLYSELWCDNADPEKETLWRKVQWELVGPARCNGLLEVAIEEIGSCHAVVFRLLNKKENRQ